MNDASWIKENPEGNNMAWKTIFLKRGKCTVITKITSVYSSNYRFSNSFKNIKKKKKNLNKLTKRLPAIKINRVFNNIIVLTVHVDYFGSNWEHR